MEANDNAHVFGRALHVLIPILLVDLKDCPELWFGSQCLQLAYPLLPILFHEFIFIEVEVIFSHFLKLLLVHDQLGVIVLVHFNCVLKNILCCRFFFDGFPVAHFDLDVFPLGCHATNHLSDAFIF